MASDNSSKSESDDKRDDQNSQHQQWLQICQQYNLQTAEANRQDAVAARQRADAVDAWSMGSRSSSEDEAGDTTGDNAVEVTVDETGEVTVDVTGEVTGEEPGNDPEQPI
ncbi:expressed unknown protein [Seminavis robusta]|uniref:Uncharacterized protein n=1 Tax=Seminavis robusta TaxID=568900 RepID=A0A9N8HPF2_9STRA|nr:expressed unknown protein [Seminavis robusta]|eukprot:Sro898_g217580.1 n/a (110) ;mRNA; f:19629-19958